LSSTQFPVYIAGIGIVSPLGSGADETVEALRKNSSAVAPLRVFEVLQQRPLPVGQVAMVAEDSTLPRAHRLAVAAARQAVKGNDCSAGQ